MSAATHSQALGTASETHAAASLAHEDDEHLHLGMGTAPTSALSIEVLHGRMGCAVFLEEEQQLFLCEDVACDFAFHAHAPVPSARGTVPSTEEQEPKAGVPRAIDTPPAYADPACGYLDSCQYHRPGYALPFHLGSPPYSRRILPNQCCRSLNQN